MKKRVLGWILVVLMVTTGGMLSAAFASPGDGRWNDDHMYSERMEHRSERRMERMAEILELSEAQQEQIEAIHEAAHEQNETYREQLKASHERIRQLCEAQALDHEAIRSEVASQVDVKTALIVSRAEVRNETLNLLTPEQRELAEKLEPRRGKSPRSGKGQGRF